LEGSEVNCRDKKAEAVIGREGKCDSWELQQEKEGKRTLI
jgi:hypothetical protein